jgi:multicomponent Na+:H+ antiporter subunit D
MPWTMAAFTLASLSLVGIPPFSGFVSKWYLAVGSLERGNPWILAVLLASSLFTPRISAHRVQGLFRGGEDNGHHIRGPLIVVPLVTALASLSWALSVP